MREKLNEISLQEGFVTVFVVGSTAAVTTFEYENGIKKDMDILYNKIAPTDEYYNHHETWNDDNGHSHVRASLMGPGISIPVINSKLIHGTWQQIVFIELDTRPRKRNLIVQIIGE